MEIFCTSAYNQPAKAESCFKFGQNLDEYLDGVKNYYKIITNFEFLLVVVHLILRFFIISK